MNPVNGGRLGEGGAPDAAKGAQLEDVQSTGTTMGVGGSRKTLPVATSICAVVMTLCARSTRGMHPRISWAARNPETTTNSNAFVPLGR
jgi:hypothetical protein